MMEGKAAKPKTVEEYIAQFPEPVQAILREVRAVVKEAAPGAEERLGYGMPGYYLKGPLVYFAAHKKHIGFYPTPEGIEAFAAELAEYKQSKGAVQFPLDQPMPYELIARMVRARVAAKG
jgi:uncharacterized protein YdhG (YjbR/CyaY superfamily)